jgi:ureidoglycolate hydrolase
MQLRAALMEKTPLSSQSFSVDGEDATVVVVVSPQSSSDVDQHGRKAVTGTSMETVRRADQHGRPAS